MRGLQTILLRVQRLRGCCSISARQRPEMARSLAHEQQMRGQNQSISEEMAASVRVTAPILSGPLAQSEYASLGSLVLDRSHVG